LPNLILVHHRNREEGAGEVLVKMAGNNNQELVVQSTGLQLQAECVGMLEGHVIHRSDTVDSSCPEFFMSQTFWIQMIL
jgi:hypothetical protein